MIEEHLKSLSEEFNFPYDPLRKALLIDIDPKFNLIYKDKNLKFFGLLPNMAEEDKEKFYVLCMQLNMALESTEKLAIGLSPDNNPYLNVEISYKLSYKQIKDLIESFANHLDKISSIIQDLNKKS